MAEPLYEMIQKHLFDTAAHESAHVIAHLICKSPFKYVRVRSLLDASFSKIRYCRTDRTQVYSGKLSL